jgi:hypothetical protein
LSKPREFDLPIAVLARAETIPLLFLQYFNANMDAWDPAVLNGFAADHEVILFNNAGVASSGGETPPYVVEMTRHCVAFCQALGLEAINGGNRPFSPGS